MTDTTEKTLAVLANVHAYITRAAGEMGISVTDLCTRAGVERSHFQRWKKSPPKTIKTLDKLLTALRDLDAEERDETETANVATA